jgi:small neutral amino acid transporter SnatA (MarC family)
MVSRDPAHTGVWAAALTGAMAVTTITLIAAGWLRRLVGERVIRAFERLMGLVLTAVAVEMLLGGIKEVAAQFRG